MPHDLYKTLKMPVQINLLYKALLEYRNKLMYGRICMYGVNTDRYNYTVYFVCDDGTIIHDRFTAPYIHHAVSARIRAYTIHHPCSIL